MKTVLLTGGTGFIGRHVIPELLTAEWRVEVLTRDVDRARRVLPADVHAIAALSEASEPAAVINLAGENLAAGRWTDTRRREIRESRLRITRDLVEFIAGCDNRPDVLISGSAVGYYGARADEVLDEDAAPADEFQSQLCVDWEAEARRAETLGVRVCLIRTGIVLGAGDGALAQMLTPFRFGLGGRFGGGRQYMPWIHIRDEVNAIRYLLTESSARGPFNLTAPEPVTNAVFTKTLAHALRRPAVMRMPAPALRLILGDMAHLLLTGQRAVPRALQAAGFEFAFPELGDALDDLVGH